MYIHVHVYLLLGLVRHARPRVWGQREPRVVSLSLYIYIEEDKDICIHVYVYVYRYRYKHRHRYINVHVYLLLGLLRHARPRVRGQREPRVVAGVVRMLQRRRRLRRESRPADELWGTTSG